jgi:hypothetical protein
MRSLAAHPDEKRIAYRTRNLIHLIGKVAESDRRRAILWLTSLCWLANFLILTLREIYDRHSLLTTAATRAALTVCGLLLCYFIHVTLKELTLGSFRKRVLIIVWLAPLAAQVYAVLNFFALSLLSDTGSPPMMDWRSAIFAIAYWTWFFVAWAAMYMALEYSFTAADEKEHSSRLQTLAYAAQLRALHNQVNPHLLFNCLNSIAALISDGRAVESESMALKLAAFFRMTLSVDAHEDIPLSREIALQLAYLEIERIRFPDLIINVDIPDRAAEARIPTLLLQPIVENAVKYGVQGSPPPGRIEIRATIEGSRLLIVVSNKANGFGLTVPAGAGIGLKNVRERLHQRYGAGQALIVQPVNQGFEVTINIPLEFAR